MTQKKPDPFEDEAEVVTSGGEDGVNGIAGRVGEVVAAHAVAENVEFELVTPERLLLSEDVEMVVIPGAEGDFGVLAGHAPMISTVRPGVVNIYEKNEISQSIFVSGGFAEVSPERCTLLAEIAMDVDDIDAKEVEATLEKERQDLEASEPESIEANTIKAKIQTTEAMLAAAGGGTAQGH